MRGPCIHMLSYWHSRSDSADHVKKYTPRVVARSTVIEVHGCSLQKAERLKQSLHCIGLAPQAKHTVFVDSAAEAAKFKPSEYFDTPAELLGRAYNRPRKSQLEQRQPAASIPPTAGDKAERWVCIDRWCEQ